MLKKLTEKWTKHEWTLLVGAFFLSFACMGIVGPGLMQASYLPSDFKNVVNNADGLVKLGYGGSNSVTIIRNLITYNAIPVLKYIFVAVATLYFSLSLFLIITSAGDEEQISKHRKALAWALLGFVFIAIACETATALNPAANPDQGINVAGAKTVIQKIITYLQLILGLIAIVAIFYAATRFITSNDNEEAIDNSKKVFFWAFIGLAIAIIADPIINTVFYPASRTPGTEEAQNFTLQALGILKFILSFLAILVFSAFLIAGFMYITSFGQEDRHNKAKDIVIGSVIGILVIATSFTLVVMFTPGDL